MNVCFGYEVISYGDAELTWLFVDEADAHRVLVEQFGEVDNVSLERRQFDSVGDFIVEQDRVDAQREEYLQEEDAA